MKINHKAKLLPMHHIFFIFLILLATALPYSTSAQENDNMATHLGGKVDIAFKAATINSSFFITQYTDTAQLFEFMLHEDIKVDQIQINQETYKFQKNKEECGDCQLYQVVLKKALSPSDTISIQTNLRFKHYAPRENRRDYKGKIASNYGILRASEQTKWFPTIVRRPNNLPITLVEHWYTYDLEVNCPDCRNVYVGKGEPQKNGGRFVSKTASQDIMLIAGAYNWSMGASAIYLNIDEDQQKILDPLFAEICQYYEATSGIKMPTKFIFAHLPSDNKRWGGFMTYPTIVNTQKDGNKKNLEAYLSHEIAHYLFGDVYKPYSSLFWLYLESFAEYFSYKYLINYHPKVFQKEYEKLQNPKLRFVRLDEVKELHEVTGQHRYVTGAFQLLAIEKLIGEAKMMELIQTVFPKLPHTSDGYAAFIESLTEIGIKQDLIDQIEADFIKKFDLEAYKKLLNQPK